MALSSACCRAVMYEKYTPVRQQALFAPFIQISAFYSFLFSRQLGTGLYPTKCPRSVKPRSGTLRGPRKSLCLSECEFAPVPNWLMGMKSKARAAKIHSFGAYLNMHSLIRSALRSLLGVLDAHGTKFLACGGSPPFIEYVCDGHHIHGGGIFVLGVDFVG